MYVGQDRTIVQDERQILHCVGLFHTKPIMPVKHIKAPTNFQNTLWGKLPTPLRAVGTPGRSAPENC